MNRVFLVGLMGAGKSHWGRQIAKLLQWQYIDLDRLIEEKENMKITELFSKHGEEHFRLLEKKYLDTLSGYENIVVAAGGGTPCFYNNMQTMNRLGETYYLQAKIETIVKRLKNKRDKRPLLKDKTAEELPAFFETMLKQREPFYLQARHKIEVEKLNKEALKKLFVTQ